LLRTFTKYTNCLNYVNYDMHSDQVMCCCVVRQEEEYDHRSLYERLKSQKDKVDADKAEQFKFSKLYALCVVCVCVCMCVRGVRIITNAVEVMEYHTYWKPMETLLY